MKKIFHPASLLLYLLAVLVFFCVGALTAGLTGAAADQGLAGGAIVFFYALLAAGLALTAAVICTYAAGRRTIVRLNKILAIVLMVLSIFIGYRLYVVQTAGTSTGYNVSPGGAMPLAPMSLQVNEKVVLDEGIGLGFFAPEFSISKTLHFYSTPNISVYDSLVFSRTEYGGFDIAYAPPRLVPEHLKPDYEILYFKVRAVSREFLEIVVNASQDQTAYVMRDAGTLYSWRFSAACTFPGISRC